MSSVSKDLFDIKQIVWHWIFIRGRLYCIAWSITISPSGKANTHKQISTWSLILIRWCSSIPWERNEFKLKLTNPRARTTGNEIPVELSPPISDLDIWPRAITPVIGYFSRRAMHWGAWTKSLEPNYWTSFIKTYLLVDAMSKIPVPNPENLLFPDLPL